MDRSRRASVVAVVGLLSIGIMLATPAAAKSKPKPKPKVVPSTTTTYNAAAAAADTAAATAALLQLSDLQPGDPNVGFHAWTAAQVPSCSQSGNPIPCPAKPVPAQSYSVLAAGNPDPAFPACATSLQIETASSKYRADTPDYYANNAMDVGNSVYVFPTVQQAKDYLATYAQPAAKECFQHGITATGANFGTGMANPDYPDFDVNTAPAGSFDEGNGFNAVAHPAPGYTGNSIEHFQDIRYRSGRAVIFLSSFQYGDDFVPGMASYLLTVRDRLNQQLKK